MKLKLVVFLSILMMSYSVMARDDVGSYSIQDAINLEQAKSSLGDQIKFFFGDQSAGEIEKNWGVFRTNKKTNAFGKSDLAVCQWAFLSAMISLRDRAIKEGGNAVINIKSNYKSNLTSSNETFQCGAGGFVAGVALVGDVVKIAE